MSEAASVYSVDKVLLVAIRDNITDTDIINLQEDLSERIVNEAARGVVIDIAALEIVDTFVGRILAQLSSISRLLAAETYIVGMRPAVAMTLVELGMDLPGSKTALSLSHALRALKAQGLA
ncbi:STAS domain-containing protein [Limimaricola sp.]|uniref:STAS domain-containing protein n=1 Tax=Limimaricola sp. TaxID=2211665 RepID=UPI0040593036